MQIINKRDTEPRRQSLQYEHCNPLGDFAIKFPNISSIINSEDKVKYNNFEGIYKEISQAKFKLNNSQKEMQVLKHQVEDFQTVLKNKVDDFDTNKKLFLITPDKKKSKSLQNLTDKKYLDFRYNIEQLSEKEKQELKIL